MALVVLGPSYAERGALVLALEGTEIGDGRRFSKLNFGNSAPALDGLYAADACFSRNCVYESGVMGVALPSSRLMESDRLLGRSSYNSDGNVCDFGVLRG
jgi:hypothetical protein